jgi:hypothetical protein
MAPRFIGFRLRVTWGWPRETSFWPKVLRFGQGLELFCFLWQVNRETHEFMDTVHLDPLGEYPKGFKIDAIRKQLKAQAVKP